MSRIIRRQGLIIIHIVLALLTLSACASSTPAASETPQATASPNVEATQAAQATEQSARNDRIRLASAECKELQTTLNQQLATEVTGREAPLPDTVEGSAGRSCRLTAKGTGKEFGSFVEVADKIRALLTEKGWTEDQSYIADGPTGTAAGFRKGSALAVMSVEWQPGPEVQCPADQPISACEVAPEQQIFDIALNLFL